MAEQHGAYQPLDYSASLFRLAQVLRPTKDGVIRCKLSMHPIGTVAYRAVSYIWRPEESLDAPDRSIHINGQPTLVHDNLFRFLTIAQEQYAECDLWIDAICIDQACIDERNHQVKRMADIFKGATAVICWFGPGDADTDAIFDMVKYSQQNLRDSQLLQHIVIEGSTLGWKVPDDASDEYKRIFHEASQSAAAIQRGYHKMANHAYWTRIWIVQEVLLGMTLIFLCGSKIAMFRDVVETLESLPRKLRGRSSGELSSETLLHASSESGATRGPHLDLVEAICKLGDKRCLNPQDRIYALLGMQSRYKRRVDDFEIDYRRTIPELLEYTLNTIHLPDPIIAGNIAQVIGVAPSRVEQLLTKAFLNQKSDPNVILNGTFLRAKEHKISQTATSQPSSATGLEFPCYSRGGTTRHQILHPCSKCPEDISMAPRPGDFLLEFRPTSLTIICRLMEDVSSSKPRVKVVCRAQYSGIFGTPEPGETHHYCPLAAEVRARLESLEPEVTDFAEESASIRWQIDWKTIFALWSHTNAGQVHGWWPTYPVVEWAHRVGA